MVRFYTRTLKSSSDFIRVLTALTIAGWSSLAARRAHNPEVAGSNPAPATDISYDEVAPTQASEPPQHIKKSRAFLARFFF